MQLTTALSIVTSDKPNDILTTTFFFFLTIKSPNSNSRIPLPSPTWRIYTLEWLDLRSLLTIMILLFVCLSGRKVYIYIIPGPWFGPISPSPSPLLHMADAVVFWSKKEKLTVDWERVLFPCLCFFISIIIIIIIWDERAISPKDVLRSTSFVASISLHYYYYYYLLHFASSVFFFFFLYSPCLDHYSFTLMSISLFMPILFLFCFLFPPFALFPCFSYAYLITLNSYSLSLGTSTYYHYYSIIISLLLQEG